MDFSSLDEKSAVKF